MTDVSSLPLLTDEASGGYVIFWNQPFLLFSKTRKKKKKTPIPLPKRNSSRVLLCLTFKEGIVNLLAINRQLTPTLNAVEASPSQPGDCSAGSALLCGSRFLQCSTRA